MTASTEHAASEPALQRRVPDFFIVGHAKSGTTALWEMLRRHPQIYMPSVKEPQYFARREQPRLGARKKSFEQTGRRPETLDEYLSLFLPARDDQRAGEASTFYLWSAVAPSRIAAARPDARIIAILREPASFLRSLHLQMVQNRAESQKDLRRAIALEDVRRQGRKIPRNAHWPEALMYTDRVRYVEQLRRFHGEFGTDQVLVLIYDDFRTDNEGTFRKVLRFLDVDETVPAQATHANPSIAIRSPRLHGMVRSVRVGSGPLAAVAKATVRGLTSSSVRREVLLPIRRRLLIGEPRPPDEALMRELRHRFRGEVLALSEYLGRDLVTLWGYDDDA
jgi:hypothetical protein